VTVAEYAPAATEVWHRILVLAPIGRDAELIGSVLRDASIESVRCADGVELCHLLAEGAGAAVIAEEALDADLMNRLGRTLADQPPWSDMPVLILTGEATAGPAKQRSFSKLGRRASVTLVDRPVRMKTLVTTVESLLRFRDRQYEIRDLLEKLEERVHERDRFLAILGHELRNPLGAILLATQMTNPDDGCLDAEHVTRIERQSRHLTRLVNDLLDLSRVTSGKIALKRSIVNFSDIVSQCLQTIHAAMEERDLHVEFEPPAEPLLVDGDPTRLDQIVSNILTNAMKYTHEGGHVRVTLERTGTEAVLRVGDDGVGIAPERLTMIFELFGQAENAIGRSQGGMGIGLALVRNLVELHSGTVTATSDGVGRGSEFVVRLPLAPADSVAPRIERREKKRDDTVATVRRVVVVEDNPDVRDLLRMKLKRLGHHVEAAADGHDGLARILRERPDVAFVDIGLPGIDGYEIANKVRQTLGESIILVALSGFGQPDDKRKAIESGFDQHLTKPVELRDIEDVLSRRREDEAC
jgi:signal transduction histidine kinase/ActR/RegA family two-component response regulator